MCIVVTAGLSVCQAGLGVGEFRVLGFCAFFWGGVWGLGVQELELGVGLRV